MSGKRYPTFEEYLKAEYQGPFMATDIVIEYGDGIVLIQRGNHPLGLGLPGGMAEKMTLAENAIKEAKEETNLDVTIKSPEQPFMVLSEVDQDPRAFIADTVFIAQGTGEIKAGDDAAEAFLVRFEDLRGLLFSGNWALESYRKIVQAYCDQAGIMSNYKVFISGHGDLTEEEFQLHYKPEIDSHLAKGAGFVVGDFRGTDTMAQDYLLKYTNLVTVCHMFDSPRYNAGFKTQDKKFYYFENDEDRDAYMTLSSQSDVAWVRPGREKSGTALNIKRRKDMIGQ
jgi:ADP-ribose pyrophosphatase YjhB (NUDIX family)